MIYWPIIEVAYVTAAAGDIKVKDMLCPAWTICPAVKHSEMEFADELETSQTLNTSHTHTVAQHHVYQYKVCVCNVCVLG